MGLISSAVARLRARLLPARQAVDPSRYFDDRRNWRPVSSSNLEAVAYLREPRRDSGTLRIRFKGGRVWEYDAVPGRLFNGLLEAGSHGRYHRQHLYHWTPRREVK